VGLRLEGGIAMQLCDIRTDGGTQPRAQLDLATISEYTEQMADGAAFPPIIVFYDGADYWLADGFHRFSAATCAGLTEIAADVRQGTIQDAQWYSYSVNQAHGLRRSNEDKRRAVEAALKHEYAAKYSNVQIARHCGVAESTIRNYRTEMESTSQIAKSDMRIGADGRAYNTSNIGKLATLPTTPHVAIQSAAQMFPYTCDTCGERFGQPIWHCLNCDHHYHIEDSECGNCHGVNDTLDPPMELEQVADQFPDELTATDRQLLQSDDDEESTLDSNEWYTPVEFIEAARTVMGSIDTDPASNDTAQAFIQAGTYYTKETNGLAQTWGPNVWLNPPYAEPLPWIEKLLAEFEAGNTKQAILLVNTANSPQWSRLLWHSNFVVCLLDRRVRFWRPDRVEAKGTAQDQMIWYIGYETDAFREAFAQYGAIR
jgi:phage N-6-adenine-methyltransferase